MSKNLEAGFIFLISLGLFVCCLPGQEIIGFDSRFYLFAQEMWRNGPSWFPTTYDQPYPDYSAASTFVIYCFALIFGGLSKFVAVLPTAMAASLTLSYTYLIGTMQCKRWGLLAVAMLFLTLGFLNSAIGIALDMYVVLFSTIAFYLVYSADRRSRCPAYFMLSLLFVLGFVFRGPIGLVIPTGIVCFYYLLTRQYRYFFIIGFLSLLYLMLGTSLLLMLAREAGGDAFLQEVMKMQVVARLGEDAQPFYYYFSHGLTTYALGFPLAFIIILMLSVSVLKARLSRPFANQSVNSGAQPESLANKVPGLHLLILLSAWMLVVVLGMSIPGEKKIRYILPAMPACALIAAYPLVFMPRLSWLKVIRKVLIHFLLYLPAISAILLGLMWAYADQYNVLVGFPVVTLYIIFALLQVTSIYIYYRFYTSPQKPALIALLAAFAFVALLQLAIEPAKLYVERAHGLVQAMEKQRQQAGAKLVFYRVAKDGLAIKYLINMPQYEKPLFVSNIRQLQKVKGRLFVLTSKKAYLAEQGYFNQRFDILASDRMGHVPVVMFESKRR